MEFRSVLVTVRRRTAIALPKLNTQWPGRDRRDRHHQHSTPMICCAIYEPEFSVCAVQLTLICHVCRFAARYDLRIREQRA